MGSYTITFTPDDVNNASAVVRVELGTSGARIAELTLRAGNGDGLVPGELAGFDLGGLMRAIAPAGPIAPALELSATPSPVTAEPYPTEAADGAPSRGTARRAAGKRGASASHAAAKRAAAKAAKQTGEAKKATKATKATRATKAAKAASGTGRTARAAAGSAAATSGGTAGRAYRRMPDDIVEVFTQAPSSTALAHHYGVPRHSVQGWLRRLRAEGTLPPPSRSE